MQRIAEFADERFLIVVLLDQSHLIFDLGFQTLDLRFQVSNLLEIWNVVILRFYWSPSLFFPIQIPPWSAIYR